ncbi:MAG TPA: hypothetical protein VFW38_03940 [Solirubrobacteraceae bacterium]|nr:hypothetical protein [Solirubrobacteraceae bacterium]
MPIPPGHTGVQIFDKLPPADADTFSKALPLLATTNYEQAMVLYAPDLENIGSIDNTTSQATTSYSETVTTGFVFSTTQTLSIEASAEVTIEVVKASLTIGFSISFTETWSSEKATTIGFSVPPGEKAFTYRGYLCTAILQYSAATGKYSYGQTGRFLTPILATSKQPLTGAATFRQL